MICYRDCTIAEAGRAICCPELGDDDPIATMSQLDWQIKRKEQSGPCKNKQEPSRQPVNQVSLITSNFVAMNNPSGKNGTLCPGVSHTYTWSRT